MTRKRTNDTRNSPPTGARRVEVEHRGKFQGGWKLDGSMAEAREKGVVPTAGARSASSDGDGGGWHEQRCKLDEQNSSTSVCEPWLSPCQKSNPDTGLKLALPVPECLASKALFYAWCEAAFRPLERGTTTTCLERRTTKSIYTTFQSARPFRLASPLRTSCEQHVGDVRIRPATGAEESAPSVQALMRSANDMQRLCCDRIRSPRSSAQSRGR